MDTDPPVPHFSADGRVFGEKERERLAKRKGVCQKCGIPTHVSKRGGVLRRTTLRPITSIDVYQGICIACFPERVPLDVREGFERQQKRKQKSSVHSNHPAGRPAAESQQQRQQQHRPNSSQSLVLSSKLGLLSSCQKYPRLVGKSFDLTKSLYIRQSLGHNNEQQPTRNHTSTTMITLVYLSDVDATYLTEQQRNNMIPYQSQSFREKVEWFRRQCQQHVVAVIEDPTQNATATTIHVHPESLLGDIYRSCRDWTPEKFCQPWTIINQYDGKPCRTQEWFHKVATEIFSLDFGLWSPSENDKNDDDGCRNINHSSHILQDDCMGYYRFFGRFLAKAVLEHQKIPGKLQSYLYKHILGWPICGDDLAFYNAEYYQTVKSLEGLDDVELLCLDFTVTEDFLGRREDVELVEGGSDMEVTNENVGEYLEALVKYHLFEKIKPQLDQLVRGFLEIIPNTSWLFLVDMSSLRS